MTSNPPPAATQLLPCPFCGETTGINFVNDTGPAMRCWTCKAEGPVKGYFDESVAREQWNRRTPAQAWIPCASRMPEDPATVIVHTTDGWIGMAWTDATRWYAAGNPTRYAKSQVTHWQPLPHPPTGAAQ